MSWLWQALSDGAGAVATALASILGHFFLFVLVKPLLGGVILPLLGATLFAPFNLIPAPGQTVGFVAQATETVWAFMASLSGAVALTALLWGLFTRTWGAAFGGPERSLRALGEGLGVWALVLAGGYTFCGLLLQAANAVTGQLTALAQGLSASLNPVAGIAGGAAAALGVLFYPLSLLVLTGVLLWVVGVWVMRQVDLIVFVGLLPLTAALRVGGLEAPFRWNWQEAVGAIFAQLAMAVAWWIAWLILGGHWVSPAAPVGVWAQQTLVGLAALLLVGRAPAMLQQLTGHQHAGMGSIVMGAMAGSLLARGAQSALRMSPAGAALHQLQQGFAAQAEATAGQWAQRPSVGEALGRTRLGQWAGRQWQAAGAAVAQSRPAQAAAGFVRRHPMLQDAAQVAGQGAQAAGRVAGHALRGARSAASFLYQPRTTLGRAMELGYARQAQGTAAATSQRAIAATAAVPPDEVQRQLGLGQTAYLQHLGADHAGTETTPPAFRDPGAPPARTFARVDAALQARGRGRAWEPAPAGSEGTAPPLDRARWQQAATPAADAGGRRYD